MVDQKLLDSIRQYLDQGVKKGTIKQALVRSGWSEKDINKAFEKVTGQKVVEEKFVKEKPPSDNRRIFFIVGCVIAVLVLAVLVYTFLFKVGFSEDIPDDLVPLEKLNNFIKKKMGGYNLLALDASSPLKDVIQNGKVNLIMTNNGGRKIIDAIGITVKDGQIVNTALKVEDPSFDVKFTEKMFDNIMIVPDPKPVFLEGYVQRKVKVKAYGKENENKLSQLNNFVQYFFIF